jgi:hypothetical protein
MCECWEFGCGHVRETQCQAYKNRVLKEGSKEDSKDESKDEHKDESLLGDDDPFTDAAGALPRTAKDHLAHTRSDSTVNRPPQFILPSPTTSSSGTSEIDAHSSTGSVGRSSASAPRDSVASPVEENIPGSVTPKASAQASDKIRVCDGPGRNKKNTSAVCYDCLLQRAKANSTSEQDERAAETRLYDEVGQQGNPAASGADRSGGVTTGSSENTDNSLRYTRGNPLYVNNAIDIGRGNPPAHRPRRGSSAPATMNRGRRNHHQPHRDYRHLEHDHDAHDNVPFLMSLHTAGTPSGSYFNNYEIYPGWGGYGYTQAVYDANAMIPQYSQYSNVGRPQAPYGQYFNIDHNNNTMTNQYQQGFQQQTQAQTQTPYQYPMEAYGTPASGPYHGGQAYLYPQMQMEMGMEAGLEMACHHQTGMPVEGEAGYYVQEGYQQYPVQTQMGSAQGQGQGQEQSAYAAGGRT